MSAHDWPGEERRRPPLSSATWAVRAPLAAWLQEQAEAGDGATASSTSAAARSPTTPSSPSGRASTSASTSSRTPPPSCVGSVEDLPVEDASFDLVLCTQVLEHCDDPAQAVRELRRVTAPGGRVLASTHGVAGLPPLAAGLLALDARRAEAAFRAERRLGVARRRRPARGTATLPRDAARHLRRDRAPVGRRCAGRRSGS